MALWWFVFLCLNLCVHISLTASPRVLTPLFSLHSQHSRALLLFPRWFNCCIPSNCPLHLFCVHMWIYRRNLASCLHLHKCFLVFGLFHDYLTSFFSFISLFFIYECPAASTCFVYIWIPVCLSHGAKPRRADLHITVTGCLRGER